MDIASYSLLFINALGAASILPLASEPLYLALLHTHSQAWFGLWLCATLANTLGGVCNWWLGRYLRRWQQQRWFPVQRPLLRRASRSFRRYGIWSLLFSWLPVIGDAFTVLAGLLRLPLRYFVPLVAIGKGLRYAMLTGVWMHGIALW